MSEYSDISEKIVTPKEEPKEKETSKNKGTDKITKM